jgi:hypothetical protein
MKNVEIARLLRYPEKGALNRVRQIFGNWENMYKKNSKKK